MTFDALRPWLAGLDRERLVRCLTLRPDTLHAELPDLDGLAAHLADGASVRFAFDLLPLPVLQVLDAVVALGAGATTDSVVALLDATATDPEDHRTAVLDALNHLEQAALVLPRGDGALAVSPETAEEVTPGAARPAACLVDRVLRDEELRPPDQVGPGHGIPVPWEGWGGRPTGWDDPARLEALADHAAVRRAVAALPERAVGAVLRRAVLRWSSTFDVEDLEAADPDDEPGTDADPGDQPWWVVDDEDQEELAALRAAVAAGLVIPDSVDVPSGVVPSEVLLALAPPGFRAPFTPLPPPVPTTEVPQGSASAAAAVTDLVSVTTVLLEEVARRPAATVRPRGVGARELVRLGRAVDAEPRLVRTALELAATAGLVEATADGVRTTVWASRWRRRRPAERAADLARTWLSTPVVVSRERRAGAPWAALADRDLDFTGRRPLLRLVTLQVHTDLGDRGAVATDHVVDAVRHRAPRLVLDPDEVGEVCWEAERLGLLAHGAATDVARALLRDGGGVALVEAYDPLLPPVERTARIGSDLSVVVPGLPHPDLADLLDEVAPRRHRGVATAWQLSANSLRAAVDAGHPVEAITAALAAVTAGPLPQALAYLLADLDRRHGRLRVSASTSGTAPTSGAASAPVTEVHADDDALAAELLADTTLRPLALHADGPRVLVTTAPVEQVLAALRAAGHAPVEVDDDDAPIVPRRHLPTVPAEDETGDAAEARTAAGQAQGPKPPWVVVTAAGEDPVVVADRLLS